MTYTTEIGQGNPYRDWGLQASTSSYPDRGSLSFCFSFFFREENGRNERTEPVWIDLPRSPGENSPDKKAGDIGPQIQSGRINCTVKKRDQFVGYLLILGHQKETFGEKTLPIPFLRKCL